MEHLLRTAKTFQTNWSIMLAFLSLGGMVINEEIEEVEISAQNEIFEFIADIALQKLELVLTKNGTTVGAVLTAEQYAWFLDQLDAQQDLSFINERINDREGSQDFASFKREIGLEDE